MILLLMSESKIGPQKYLDGLQSYCQKWKLVVNTKKTEAMVMTNRWQNARCLSNILLS